MKTLLLATEFPKIIGKLAADITQRHKGAADQLALIGIHTRGVPLANRLMAAFTAHGLTVQQGMLDISLYRDDLSEVASMPIIKETKIDFSINGKIVYLVDDVLYTGRTIRAAMDALFDLGRPQAVHLVVMTKRSGRELPIDTDLFALNIETEPTDNIKVKFVETDGEDGVTLL